MSPAAPRWAVSTAALVLAAVAAALLFAPEEVAGLSFPGTAPPPALLSLLGAAYAGFAAMNWVARRSPLGGIYGRAVVIGDQVHFLVGALVLVRHAFGGGSALSWAAAALFTLGAGAFTALLVGRPGGST